MPQRIILFHVVSSIEGRSLKPILYFISPYTKPALKLSPAPIVQTGTIGMASYCMRYDSVKRFTPSDPCVVINLLQ